MTTHQEPGTRVHQPDCPPEQERVVIVERPTPVILRILSGVVMWIAVSGLIIFLIAVFAVVTFVAQRGG